MKSLESSVKCQQKGCLLDMEYNWTILFALFCHRTEVDFQPTLRLMRLILAEVPPLDVTDDERQLRIALLPLVHNRDSDFLATLCLL